MVELLDGEEGQDHQEEKDQNVDLQVLVGAHHHHNNDIRLYSLIWELVEH